MEELEHCERIIGQTKIIIHAHYFGILEKIVVVSVFLAYRLQYAQSTIKYLFAKPIYTHTHKHREPIPNASEKVEQRALNVCRSALFPVSCIVAKCEIPIEKIEEIEKASE